MDCAPRASVRCGVSGERACARARARVGVRVLARALACLLARLPCLLACLLARWLACLLACIHACMHALVRLGRPKGRRVTRPCGRSPAPRQDILVWNAGPSLFAPIGEDPRSPTPHLHGRGCRASQSRRLLYTCARGLLWSSVALEVRRHLCRGR